MCCAGSPATIPVMLIVAVLVFLMLRLTPSDPAAIIAGDNANSEQVAEIRKRLGLDQPILTQFVIWIGKTLQGDLGESFFFKKQVTELILDRLEPTLSLARLHHRPRRADRRAARRRSPPTGTAAGSTASSWASRCSASRCRCS